MNSVGEELRLAREQKHLTIEDISLRTRISTRYLGYMEEDRFDMLPGGIFNRAFLKAYGCSLGIDTVDLLERYEKVAPPQKNLPNQSWPILYNHRPLIRFLVSWGITLALIVVCFTFIYREVKSNRALIKEAQTQEDRLTDLSLLPPTTVLPSQIPETTIAVGIAEKRQIQKPSFPLNLVIEAINQCWVSISADGRQITSQLLARGDRLPFRANHQISLILGNAGGVNLHVNGVKLRRLGGLGEVKRFVFTPQNYTEFKAERVTP